MLLSSSSSSFSWFSLPEEVIAPTQQKLFLPGATTTESISVASAFLPAQSRSGPAAQRHPRSGLLIESIGASLRGARSCDVSFDLWYLRTPVGALYINPQKYGTGLRFS